MILFFESNVKHKFFDSDGILRGENDRKREQQRGKVRICPTAERRATSP
jgi:hypothetical protein